jgi:hypothetical protein
VPLEVVSFQLISRILDVTDGLGLNREWVEIPLSPESPGRSANSRMENLKSSSMPTSRLKTWLGTLEQQIRRAQTT